MCKDLDVGHPCRAWNYCGAISGCMSQAYQNCQLLNSTAAKNLSAPDGFLNYVKNSSIRSTAGKHLNCPTDPWQCVIELKMEFGAEN